MKMHTVRYHKLCKCRSSFGTERDFTEACRGRGKVPRNTCFPRAAEAHRGHTSTKLATIPVNKDPPGRKRKMGVPDGDRRCPLRPLTRWSTDPSLKPTFKNKSFREKAEASFDRDGSKAQSRYLPHLQGTLRSGFYQIPTWLWVSLCHAVTSRAFFFFQQLY